jgi:hypothetical protein
MRLGKAKNHCRSESRFDQNIMGSEFHRLGLSPNEYNAGS